MNKNALKVMTLLLLIKIKKWALFKTPKIVKGLENNI